MSELIYRHEAIKIITSYNGVVDKSVAKRLLLQMPSAQPGRAIKDCRNCKHGNYNDHWDTYFCYYSGDCNDWDKWEPSAEPEQQWIPCSETKKNPDHEILACGRRGEMIIGYLVEYSDDQWLCESETEILYDVVAWREKPKPYTERSQDD